VFFDIVILLHSLIIIIIESNFFLHFGFYSACSKYFEGLLLILVRRPYDIGDRIAVSNVNVDTNTSGSTSWFVRDVTLVRIIFLSSAAARFVVLF
jgi:hypothetical protein